MNYKVICTQAIQIVEEVSTFIEQELGRVTSAQVESKAQNSLVSYVDQEAESRLVKGLGEIIPDSGFVTEEDTVDSPQAYTWIIDPLDGTTNFLHGIPHFSISVALRHDEELVLGIIADVMRGDIYHGIAGQGAYLNANRIEVSRQTTLKDSIIATGFPYDAAYNKTPYLKMLQLLMAESRGIRRFGSAALDMAYVAAGRFEAFYETSLSIWDIAAGMVICKEAGALCTDYYRSTNPTGRSIIVANPDIHEQLVQRTSSLYVLEEIPLS